MNNTALDNRITNVRNRFSEIVTLLNGLNIDDNTYDQLMERIQQSHENEIGLMRMIEKMH